MATTISHTKSDADRVITGKSLKGDEEMQWIKLKNLGSGSSGVVDLVKIMINPISCKPAAVKRSPVATQETLSLEKEFRVLQRFLGCPNIVQVCGGDMKTVQPEQVFTTENSGRKGCITIGTKLQEMPYYNLLLEYAPGGDLRRLMKKYHDGRIPEYLVRRYTRMIVEGLRDIHKRGYVHCDLKPANILVFPSCQYGQLGTLKIADFGLAKEPGEADDLRVTFRGTQHYMSPESVNEGKISAALDIWSLGCVVVEMMTGEVPWDAKMSRRDLEFEIGFSNDIPDIPKNISTTGKDFLMKCFARDPDYRWSADSLISHLFLSRPPGF